MQNSIKTETRLSFIQFIFSSFFSDSTVEENMNEFENYFYKLSVPSTKQNKDIVIALNSIGADVGFAEIESDNGHDSFLLDIPDFLSALKNFLDKSYEEN